MSKLTSEDSGAIETRTYSIINATEFKSKRWDGTGLQSEAGHVLIFIKRGQTLTGAAKFGFGSSGAILQ